LAESVGVAPAELPVLVEEEVRDKTNMPARTYSR
jgi:hypothetical protein